MVRPSAAIVELVGVAVIVFVGHERLEQIEPNERIEVALAVVEVEVEVERPLLKAQKRVLWAAWVETS